MIRHSYNVLMLALVPLLRRRLLKRGRMEPGYLVAIEERFGHYPDAETGGFVWVHAVSLGETRAAAVLIARLRAMLPGMRLLLTHGTATGRAEGKKLLRPGDVAIAEYQGEPAAFAAIFPNLNEAIADMNGRLLPFNWVKLLWRMKVSRPKTARMPMMGVRK